MHTKQIGEDLFVIDLQTGGFKNLIASYVLKGEKVFIVETGPTSSISNLLLGLMELDVKPEKVVFVALSHVHLDHAGGIGSLLRYLPNAKVVVHSKGALHLQDPSKLWAASKQTLGPVAEMFGEPEPVPEERIVVASEGEVFDAGKGLKLQVVESSGHASHSLSFYEPLNQGMFTGDSAGAYLPEFGVVFPTTPPPFRPDFALISLDKLISFNPKVLYYSHFGIGTDGVQRLRGYQVQIRRWLSIVEEGLRRGEGREEISERVFREDETITAAVPALKANAVHRKTLIENSVRGFIDFAQNPQI